MLIRQIINLPCALFQIQRKICRRRWIKMTKLEAEVSKPSKRPLQESDDNSDCVSFPKKRKEHKDSVKKQKAAAIATANEIAKTIFQERNTNVINYSETQKQRHLQEIKELTGKVKELSDKLEDKESSIDAKRVVITNLEEKAFSRESAGGKNTVKV